MPNPTRRRPDWNWQLVTIYEKGMEAFRRGEPRESCPYLGGYNGGGNLQKQRRGSWHDGWDEARKRDQETTQ